MTASAAIGDRILRLLDEAGVAYELSEHAPAPTCEASALARGAPVAIGGKTLLMKAKGRFSLFVLSAALRADSRKIRKILGSQKVRFARPEEFLEIAGVERGALPPFGRPILPLDLYVDRSILENDRVAFNCGVLTRSVILSREDYLQVVDAQICAFSQEKRLTE